MATKTIEKKPVNLPYIDMSQRQFANVLFVGLGVGIVMWLLQLVLSKYVYGPIMCHDSLQASCSSVENYANTTAAFLATAGGLVALVRLRVYRPLLVAIAALIAIWGVSRITEGMTWPAALATYAVLNAAIYGLFTWLARIRSFLLSVILIVIALVLIRIALA